MDDNKDMSTISSDNNTSQTDSGLYGGYPVEDIPEQYRDTSRYRILKNGAVLDNQSKRPIVAKLPGKNDITTANSGEFHKKRALARAKAETAFRQGMAGATPAMSSLGTWRAIGQAQAELALDSDRGLPSTRAAEFVGKASGFLGNDPDGTSTAGASISISSDVARALIDAIAARNRGEGE